MRAEEADAVEVADPAAEPVAAVGAPTVDGQRAAARASRPPGAPLESLNSHICASSPQSQILTIRLVIAK